MKADSTDRKGGVGRVVAILEAFDGSPVSQAEIARRSGLSEPTAFRYLSSLAQHGLLDRDEASGRYQLGVRLFQLGQLALRSRPFPAAALPIMERLRDRFQETVNLSVRYGDQLVLIGTLESARLIKRGTQLGGQDPWHASAVGKAVLAFLPEVEARALVARCGYRRFTQRTRTSWNELTADLEATRRRGYAVDIEEFEDEMCCVGAPIVDTSGRAMGALGLSGSAQRFTTQAVEEMGNELKSAATQIVARPFEGVSAT
jgi:DNA-binding IclR family transcriptional regulator